MFFEAELFLRWRKVRQKIFWTFWFVSLVLFRFTIGLWVFVFLGASAVTVTHTELKLCGEDEAVCVNDLRDCGPRPPSSLQREDSQTLTQDFILKRTGSLERPSESLECFCHIDTERLLFSWPQQSDNWNNLIPATCFTSFSDCTFLDRWELKASSDEQILLPH